MRTSRVLFDRIILNLTENVNLSNAGITVFVLGSPGMLIAIRALDYFWQRNPCFRYGLAALLGTYAALNGGYLLILPILLLSLSQHIMQTLLCVLIFLVSFALIQFTYIFPKLPPEGIAGIARIHIDSLQAKTSHFGRQWIYKGRILSFTKAGESQPLARNIDYTLSLPFKEEIERPPADRDYWIESHLKETSGGNYRLSVKKTNPWNPIEGSWSLAEWRFFAKQWVAESIERHFRSSRSAAFLTGIATGDFDDRIMSAEFSRFGLQHIMAISGFHFSIIAGVLSFLLRLLFPPKKTNLLMIAILTTYFVFLGCGPSILRAWLTILIALLGMLLQRKGSGLNALGLALLLSLLIDPLMCQHMGFQFSFLTTAAILLLFGPFDHSMQRLFFKRSLSEAIAMDGWNQHGYCLLAVFRQALSLGIAVNCAALPLTLFYFQKFPYFSLIYNLFFPFLVSLSMLLLILGFLIPVLGHWIHLVNDRYTHCVLNFTYNLPPKLDIAWYHDCPLEVLLPYLCLLLVGGILLQHYLRMRHESFRDLAYA